jgi:hypothetical protein
MSTDPSSLEFYKREGYAIFKKVYSADTIAAVKRRIGKSGHMVVW